jgi:RHS repeat-associated protein
MWSSFGTPMIASNFAMIGFVGDNVDHAPPAQTSWSAPPEDAHQKADEAAMNSTAADDILGTPQATTWTSARSSMASGEFTGAPGDAASFDLPDLTQQFEDSPTERPGIIISGGGGGGGGASGGRSPLDLARPETPAGGGGALDSGAINQQPIAPQPSGQTAAPPLETSAVAPSVTSTLATVSSVIDAAVPTTSRNSPNTAVADAIIPLPAGDIATFSPIGADNQFAVRGITGYQTTVSSTGATFSVGAGSSSNSVSMTFAGGNSTVQAVTEDVSGTGSRSAGEVIYPNVWKGVSVTFTGNASGQLEDTFSVQPFADPSQIATTYSGTTLQHVDQAGDLIITLNDGQTITQSAPTMYQVIGGVQVPVTGSYLIQNNIVGFSIGTYDRAQPLIIDPTYYYSISDQTNTVGDTVSVSGAVSGAGFYTASGLPSGLSIDSSTGLISGTLADGTVNTSGYSVEVDGSGGGNDYIADFTWYVDPASLTITADDQSMNYGGSVPTLTVSYSGLVNGDTAPSTPPTVSTTATSSSPVSGSPYDISASGASDSDYTISYVGGSMTVNPVPLTITADDQSMTYGGSVPTLTVTYSGLVNGDTAPSTPPAVSTTATSSSPVSGSPYDISASGASDSDYTISYVDGSMTVNPAALTVTADDQSMTYGDSVPTLTVSYSGLVNGDTAPSTPPTVSTTATSSSPVSGSPYDISASGASDPNYTISYVDGAMTINPAPTSTSVSSSDPDAGIGDDVVFTAAVTSGYGIPTGTVTFTDGSTTLGTGSLDGSGIATFDTVSGLALGTHQVVAEYAGDGNFLASSSNNLTEDEEQSDDPADESTVDCGCPQPADEASPATGTQTNAPDSESSLAEEENVDGDTMNVPDANSEFPIRYSDGTVDLVAFDLSSSGIGPDWGQTRSWTNGGGYDVGQVNGAGWVDSQMPRLLEVSGTSSLAVTLDGQSALFFNLSGSNYVEQFAGGDNLSYDSGTDTYSLATSSGEVITFDGFSSTWLPAQQGQFTSMSNLGGTSVSVTSWTSNGNIAEVQASAGGITDSYQYSYISSGDNAGLLSSVNERRSTDGGSTWTNIQSVQYTYYNWGDSGGNAGDLETATVEDASGNPISTDYYRYYTEGATGGYAGALKYAVLGASYDRLKTAAGGTDADVAAASDSTVATYADHYFQYDSSGRVTEEVASGAGCSVCSGGLGTFDYSYTTSSNSPGANNWQTKTVESLPDGNEEIVYTNAYGEIMLSVFQDNSTSQQWDTYYEYDSQGRCILMANPSAVTGFDDSYADLVNWSGSSAAGLSSDSGLITDYTYYTSSGSGAAAGYQESLAIQQGTSGTPISQEAWTYSSHTAGSVTVYNIATATVYRNDDGTGAEETSYSYTYFSGTDQIESVTTTLPTVTTAQNGPNSSTSTVDVYNEQGQVVWTKDESGNVDYTAYDPATGAVVEQINNVSSAIVSSDSLTAPSGWTIPSGVTSQVTTYEVDALGRTTKETDPNGNVTYTAYDDADHVVRVYPGWNARTHTTTGPTEVYDENWGNSYTETLTMTAAPAYAGTSGSYYPTGTESISGVISLSRTILNAAGQTVESDDYFDLSGVTYSASSVYLGTSGTSYYATKYAYNHRGLLDKTVTPSGTIYRTVYDGLGRVVSTWIGTDDMPTSGYWSPSNAAGMVETAAYVYDNGGVGDGDLTQMTLYTGVSSGDPNEVTQYSYDWRNRQVAEKQGVQSTETDDVNRPITITTYNNLNQVTQVQVYDGDGVDIPVAADISTFQSTNASLLRAQSETYYDNLGQVYETEVDSVDPSSGSVGSALTSETYYDSRGHVIEQIVPNGPVTTNTYNGLGELTATYSTDGASGTSYSDASSVSGDIVLSQTEYDYDADGNVIETIESDRLSSDSSTATGALSDGTVSGVGARISYGGDYYDAANRLIAEVDMGTNGGSAWSNDGTVPSRSSTALVTSYDYDSAGNQEDVIDPNGIDTRTYYDNFRRPTETIQDYSTSSGHLNTTTEYAYGPAGMTSLTSVVPGGTNQTTAWVYGVTTSGGSAIDSNDIVGATEYPDPTTGDASSSQEMTQTVDAQGKVITSTDRNGNTHTYSYDALGRQIADVVTTLGSGVDGSILRIETAYDGQGNPYLITSYNAASAGSVVNQVENLYNGFGQLLQQYQSASGAVDTSTTPSVRYTYSGGSSGNNSRLSSIVYPDGYTVNYNYGTSGGTDDAISRISSLSDSTGTLQSYTYLGLNSVVGYSDLPISLTQADSLDQFGRISEMSTTVSSTTVSDYQYLYDDDGNVLSKYDGVNTELSQVYAYDNLGEVTSFEEGALNSGHTAVSGTPSQSQSWDYDALGNWTSVTTNSSTQTRDANAQNEYTSISGATTPAYDSNGNLTTDENGLKYVYDAWNRLVAVENSSATTLETYEYDGLDRRIAVTNASTSTTTDLYYSSAWQVFEESVAGVYTERYVWSPVYVNALVLRDTDTSGTGLTATGSSYTRLWVIQDANWNVVALVNSSGTVVERYDYTPFGQVTVLNADGSVKSGGTAYNWIYLFQGGRLDTITGDYIFQMRNYDPVLGRWTSMDPTGFGAGDADLYRTEGNDLVGLLDPSGLEIIWNRLNPNDFSEGKIIPDPRPLPDGTIVVRQDYPSGLTVIDIYPPNTPLNQVNPGTKGVISQLQNGQWVKQKQGKPAPPAAPQTQCPTLNGSEAPYLQGAMPWNAPTNSFPLLPNFQQFPITPPMTVPLPGYEYGPLFQGPGGTAPYFGPGYGGINVYGLPIYNQFGIGIGQGFNGGATIGIGGRLFGW